MKKNILSLFLAIFFGAICVTPAWGAAALIVGLGGSSFGASVLSVSDDGSSAPINITTVFPAGLSFFGKTYSSIYVNNNGNITFAGPQATFTPSVLTGQTANPIIAPYFADVDTRGRRNGGSLGGTSQGSNMVYWDLNTINGVVTVTWDDVGYFNAKMDKVNAFQLRLFNRGAGDFDVEFRYEYISWTTGDMSGGVGGLGGTVARAGWSSGNGVDFYELPESGSQASMLGLSGTTRRWSVVNGKVVKDSTPPVITLRGGSVNYIQGSEYTEPGYTAIDNIGGDITGNVKVTGGPVQRSASVGAQYTLRYNVTDTAGNRAVAQTRKVRVVQQAIGDTITTVGSGQAGVVDGPVATASFASVRGMTFDAKGNLYMIDGNYIRKIDTLGNVTTLSGTRSPGWVNGPAAGAEFFQPEGIAVDPQGNLYVADTYNNAIRKIDTLGNVTTVAGLAQGYGYVDGPAAVAKFVAPHDIVIDAQGNLYVAEDYHIRKIDTAGNVTTVARVPAWLRSITLDAQGNFYVVGRTSVHKVDAAGNVTLVAGSINNYGFVDGPAATARFADLRGITLDSLGNLYVTDSMLYDYRSRIRKIDTSGNVTTLAESGVRGFVGGGRPWGIINDAQGNLYVGDSSRIRKVILVASRGLRGDTKDPVIKLAGGNLMLGLGAPFTEPGYIATDNVDGNITAKVIVRGRVNTAVAGTYALTYHVSDASGNNASARTRYVTVVDVVITEVTTVAGTGVSGYLDGAAATAQFTDIAGISIDSQGNVYVLDRSNYCVRKVNAAGNVSTVTACVRGGRNGLNGSGTFYALPGDMTIDARGNLYVLDGNRIRKVDTARNMTTVAGRTGAWGYVDGPGSMARFSALRNITIDAQGNLYVLGWSSSIRKIDTAGNVTTVVRMGGAGYLDGPIAIAKFSGYLSGLVSDAQGNLYVADADRIRKIDIAGNVTTVAGTGVRGYVDGPATTAQLAYPSNLTLDARGNLYVTEIRRGYGFDGYGVRKIDTAGNVTTVVASGTRGFVDGLNGIAQFDEIIAMAIDAQGNLIIGDSKRLRKIAYIGIVDSDGDGIPDPVNLANPQPGEDAFPNDPAASVDFDGDGYPDFWNANATQGQISASYLTLDSFPNDPAQWASKMLAKRLLMLNLGDVNGNGSGDFAVLGKRKDTGRYVVRVKDPNTVPHLIREIGLNGAYKPVQMVRLPDMNGNGSSEIAVLEVDPATGMNRQIQVKDSRTGAKIVNIPLKASVKPHMLVVLPDVNGNGSADLAVLEVDSATGLNRQIQVKDGRTGALIQNIRVSTAVKPHMLVSLGLINGAPALALSEVDVVTGKNMQIQVKNARTGAKIVNIRVKGSVKPHMLVALPDVNGNGSPDLALSEVDAVTGKNVQIQVKDGKTGALIQNIRVNTAVKPHVLVSIGNINAVPALALSEVNAVTGKNVQIQVKNARTGAKIRNITVSRTYKPNSMIVLADINGNGAPELALSEMNATTGKIVQVQVKDAQTGAKIRNIPMNPNYTPLGMETGPDSNGNGIAEIGLLEVNAAGNVQVQIKGPLTGAKVINLPYPNF